MLRFRPLRLLTAACLVTLVTLVQLGQWQWQRYNDKKAAATRGIERITLLSFTPVKDQIQLVYGVANGKGVWRVFVPVRSDDRYTFIDVAAIESVNPPDWRTIKPPFEGEAAIQGVPVRPHAPSVFSPSPDKAKHVWYAVDLPEMVKAVGGEYGPNYYVAVPHVGPDGALKDNPFASPNGGDSLPPERHLGYAVTWWGLAAALVAIYIAYHIRAGRLSFPRRGK